MESDNFLDTLQVGNVILFKNLFNTSIAIFSKGKNLILSPMIYHFLIYYLHHYNYP